MTKQMISSKKGIMLALAAFFMWGCYPFYFKQLDAYHPIEIIVHRIVWTFALLLLLLLTKNRQSSWRQSSWHSIKAHPKWLLLTLLSGVLIAGNWLAYVWAVQQNQLLEASLGYFMNPLFGVALAFFVLKERLRFLQFWAVILATIGVGLQLILLGKLPMISLVLAATFSIYGLMHRHNPLDGQIALFIETAWLVPIGLLWLWTQVPSSAWAFLMSPSVLVLMLAGPITLLPLLLYNRATKLVRFNSLSFMNYITPTMVFFIALFYYKEPFTLSGLAVFALIWLGLVLFSMDMVQQQLKQNPRLASSDTSSF